jgi:hypothetical protein
MMRRAQLAAAVILAAASLEATRVSYRLNQWSIRLAGRAATGHRWHCSAWGLMNQHTTPIGEWTRVTLADALRVPEEVEK